MLRVPKRIYAENDFYSYNGSVKCSSIESCIKCFDKKHKSKCTDHWLQSRSASFKFKDLFQ